MIVRYTGVLTDVAEDSVILEREGVAREVLVPAYALIDLAPMRGDEVTLHTTEIYEGSQSSGNLVPRMLGFTSTEDRAFFMLFVGVKGIGPRKALKALAMPVRKIATWIETSDAKSLTGLPGIGKRAAELMIATLKGKLAAFAIPAEGGDTLGQVLSNAQKDALDVLLAWGDTRADAQRFLQRAGELEPGLETPEEWVRVAYRVKTGAVGT